jgi:hypothetical protein
MMNNTLTNAENMATTRQTWAIFCGFKVDVRGKIDFETASKVISLGKGGKADEAIALLASLGFVAKGKPAQDWKAVYDEAHAAGMAAVEKLTVVPMIVQDHANPLDDNSPVTKEYFVADGVCGFASIVVRPGTCSFAKWLTKNELAGPHYYGGVSIPVHYFNQSLQRKETYAHAFAEVLNKHGIKSRADSRMD